MMTAAAAMGVVAVFVVLAIRWGWPRTDESTKHESIRIVAPSPPPLGELPEQGDDQSGVEDLMKRLSDRGWLVSAKAYEGLPVSVLRRDLQRLALTVERVGGRFSLERDNYAMDSTGGPSARWRVASGSSVAGPDGLITAIPAASAPVPVKLVPDPAVVRAAIRWRDSPHPVDLSATFGDLVQASGRVGRSMLFKTGAGSDCRATVPHPQPGVGTINARAFLVQSICDADRAVFCGNRDEMLARTERALNSGAPDGGRVDVRLKTIALNESTYLLQAEPGSGEPPYRLLVFPIADAWPVNLAYADLGTRRGPTTVVLGPELSEPSEAGRSLLFVPRPEGAPGADVSGRDETLIEPTPIPAVPLWGSPPTGQERIAIPESWAKDAALLSVRKGPGWRPFGETYAIEKGIDPKAVAAGDIRLIVLFGCATEQEIEALVRAASRH